MIEKGEIITLENNKDYVISNILIEKNIKYYLLLKLDENEVTDEFLIVKENNENSFEIVPEDDFNEIKKNCKIY